jgi:hypothetical protein
MEINEKSVSKQQQKFFGVVRGIQTGEIKSASPAAKKAAASMSKKDVKDFAATKHKGLPKKVDELKTTKENVKSTDKKPEVFTKPDGKRGVRMVSVDREVVKNEETDDINEKGKGLWHNIRAKRKRGEPRAKPGDKDYPKTLNIESTELDEVWRKQSGFMPTKRINTSSAKYKEAEMEYQRDQELARKRKQQKPAKKESTDAYGKSMDAIANKKKKAAISKPDLDKLSKLSDLMKRANEATDQGKTFEVKQFSQFISELTDKQKAEIAARKTKNLAKRGARRGPSKGTKPSEGDWTAQQQKSAKPLSFEINKNDKHDDVHKTLAKAADASHPSLGGRKVTVKINGKSKEMAHKDLQHAVDLHKRLPLGKKAAVMNLIRDKGHDGVTAAANHFRKTYK